MRGNWGSNNRGNTSRRDESTTKALKLSAFLANLLLTLSDREFFVEAAFFLD